MEHTKDGTGDQPQFDPTKNNVEAIVRLEKEALLERTPGERVSDTIVRVAGSLTTVIVHVVIIGLWVIINLGFIPGLPIFDPFPFGIMTLIVSSEGVFLALFILVSQNRMTRQADRRAHLDLQISLLAEQELTMILRQQQRLCRHLGMEAEDSQEELEELARTTDLEKLANALEEQLPDE